MGDDFGQSLGRGEGGIPMALDKSLSYYGKTYHSFIDPLLKEARNQIINLIPENSKVFDAGCGTGVLSLLLRKKRNCTVVGADLSLKMIDFAKKSNPHGDVNFLHMDVGDITGCEEHSFDYSVMCQVIHELPSDKQLKVVNELLRVARKTIILDSSTPLPKNAVGLVIRMMDATFGRDHYDNFKSYLVSGGIDGILERAGVKSKVIDQLVFNKNCQQIVVLSS
jgi:ubiquinone/menaquinone biosynthesis C-methylase UbiE